MLTCSEALVFHLILTTARGCSDVKQNDFVCTSMRVRPRQLCWIAGIAQLLELNALDNASGIHVQAGDDPLGQMLRGHRSSPEFAGLLPRIFPDEIARQKRCRAPLRRKILRRS